MTAVCQDRRMSDDVSIIIVDMSPHAGTSFAASALKHSQEVQPSGGLFSCFKPSPRPPKPSQSEVLDMLADVDCLVAYPVHTNQLMKSSLPLTAGGQFKRRSEDFTVHGANRAQVFSYDRSWHTGDSVHGTRFAAAAAATTPAEPGVAIQGPPVFGSSSTDAADDEDACPPAATANGNR
eukprot:jgi/Chrzof1/6814/UNPLg00881.t1